jgi:hypothetical protein
MSPLTDGTTQQSVTDASTHPPPCQVKFYKWWPESRAGSGFGPFGRLIRTPPVGDAEFRRVPLDKREGSVKGKLVLGSAEAPLFRQRG